MSYSLRPAHPDSPMDCSPECLMHRLISFREAVPVSSEQGGTHLSPCGGLYRDLTEALPAIDCGVAPGVFLYGLYVQIEMKDRLTPLPSVVRRPVGGRAASRAAWRVLELGSCENADASIFILCRWTQPATLAIIDAATIQVSVKEEIWPFDKSHWYAESRSSAANSVSTSNPGALSAYR